MAKAVLFTVMKQHLDRQPRVAVLRMDTLQWHDLLLDAADARYIPTRHLVFVRQGTLMAVRFDLATLKVIGEPSPLVENVMQAFSDNGNLHSGAGQFAVSNTGMLIYAAGGVVPDEQRPLVWVNRNRKGTPVMALQTHLTQPRLSP